MTEFEPPIPILRSFDEAAAKKFYVDFLGFEIEFEHRFEPETPLYMGICRDGCRLHISEHFGDATPGSSIRIGVPDVHSLCRQLNDKRYRHARPGVQSQSWGTDEMTISDPSGNKLIFYSATET